MKNIRAALAILFLAVIIAGIGFLGTTIALTQTSACGRANMRPCKIGVVRFSHALDGILTAFQKTMAKNFGYVAGTTATYVLDEPDGRGDTLDARMQAILDTHPDLLFVIATPTALTAKRLAAGKTNVLFQAFDPISTGVVDSIIRPLTMTGIRHGDAEQKRVEWLTLLVPGIERLFIPYNPADGSARASLASIQQAADLLKLKLTVVETRTTEEVHAAVDAMPADTQALFMPADSLVASQIPYLAQVAATRNIPLSVVVGQDVNKGALFSYGFDFELEGAQFARMADQILRGVAAGDLPVETAEYKLTINMAVAERLGLNVNGNYLVTASRIIYAKDLLTPTATP